MFNVQEDAKRRDDEARQQEEDVKLAEDGRRKRRVRIPVRFQQAVQGKELERIYVEKGVIDRTESMNDEGFANPSELETNDCSDEIIGHLQDKDGSNLADLVFESAKSRGGRKSLSKSSAISAHILYIKMSSRCFRHHKSSTQD